MSGGALWSEEDGLVPARRLAPWMAALLLAFIAALLAIGLGAQLASHPAGPARTPGADAALYRHTIQDVARGQSYYAAAPRELRRGGFPLRPFMAVRPPLLAIALARLPGEPARAGVLALLAVACFSAWAWRLRQGAAAHPWRYAGMLLLLLGGVGPGFAPNAYLFHETWAGLLIALSLALHNPRRWAVSVALGLVAALLRELAAPYLLVMAAFAVIEGRRAEAAAWGGALAAFAAALAVHAMAASAAATAADLGSPGWLGLGGWPFVLSTIRWNALLLAAPGWVAAVAAPVAVLGLLTGPGGLARRIGAVALGYAAGFCVVGRVDNAYWGLLTAPLWPLGLMAAAMGLRSVAAQLRLPTIRRFGGALATVR